MQRISRSLAVILFTLASSLLYAQDWIQNSDELYYWSSDNQALKMAPDYSTINVYYRNTPSPAVLSRLSARYPETQMYNRHKMIEIKDEQGFGNLTSDAAVDNFLRGNNLNPGDGYEVAPTFLIEGQMRAQLTWDVIVRLRPGVTNAAITSLLNSYQATMKNGMLPEIRIITLRRIEQQLDFIQAMKSRGFISWGQPNFMAEKVHTNDPLYPEQFQMNNTGIDIDGSPTLEDVDVDAPEAWAITTGNPNVTVTVVDDGVENHEDLPVVSNGFTPATNGDGSPFANGDHGEAVAGIITAQHENSIGVRGLAPGSTLHSVNIFSGSETINDFANTFTWAKENGADVISNSWGFTNRTCDDTNVFPALTDAINDAATNGRGGLGCIIVFSSGNGASTFPGSTTLQDCVPYPGNLENVIAVGAVSPLGNRSLYSDFGPTLDVVAPSNDLNAGQTAFTYGVRTTDREGAPGYNNGNYDLEFGGTSAACPAVSGVVALILAVNPGLNFQEVYNILTTTADDMGPNGFDNEFGYGRVNAHQAVIAAQNLNTNSPPVARFTATPTTGEGPLTVSFNASASSDSDGDPLTYSWDFGDGNSGSGVAPVHIYNSEGTYTARLTVNDGALSDIATATITVTPPAPCDGFIVINSEGFESSSGIWQDGGSDAARVNNSNYATTGSYSMEIRDNSSSSNITTFADDYSGFSQLLVQFGYYTRSMDNSNEDFWLQISTDGGATYTTVEEWNLGDEFQNNTFYTDEVFIDGPFSANTRIRFRCDASSNADWVYIDDVIISGCSGGSGGGNRPPVAVISANPTSGTVPLTVNFNGNGSSDPDGDNLTYSWAFGDGGTATGISPVHTFNTTGTFTTTLTVSDGEESSQATQTITVSPANVNNPPSAAFTANPTSGTAPLNVAFDASGSSDPDGDNLSYSWAFGDGATAMGVSVNHTYNGSGSFTATLTVNDGEATDQASRTITVSPASSNDPPTASFTATPTSGTAPLPVNFDASASSDPNGDQLTYNWNFGDGGSATGVNPSYTYSIPGTYTAVLTVDDGEFTDQATQSITVSEGSGGGPCTTVTINSEDFETGWGIWQDGGSDAARTFSNGFANSGSYSISLRDNSSSSIMTTGTLDLSTFQELTVDFSYLGRSMETNEDFWLQISTNGGGTYTTVEEWSQGDEFVNNARMFDAVTIQGPFSNNTRVRFRCDASSNSDWVYIDDVVLTGCTNAALFSLPDNPSISSESNLQNAKNPERTFVTPITGSGNQEEFMDRITIFPNPTTGLLNIKNLPEEALVEVFEVTGRKVLQAQNTSEIDLNNLPEGIYELKVNFKRNLKSFKVIKQ